MIKLFCRALPLVAIAVLGASTSFAQYVETGDAGTNLATAQRTGVNNTTPLTTIGGSILSVTDGDFFYITITNPATFSATTVGGSTLDTILYLFTLNGTPVILNDDAPGGASLQSRLPAGSASLSIGTYIIGISINGVEPVNAANQLLFADANFSTDIRGPRAGAVGPVTGVSGPTYTTASDFGAYTITLTGAATSATNVVPEPGTLALLAFSGVGGLVLLRRRFHRS